MRLPEIFVAACAYVDAHPEARGLFAGDLDVVLARDPGRGRSGTLAYPNLPLELFSFARTGDAGLQYAWAVPAPELDLSDPLCVTIAPNDEGPFWLGDTTKQALENLLVGRVRWWERSDSGEPSPTEHPAWKPLCAALGLAPDLASEVRGGGYTSRRITPHVPPGYRWAPIEDNVGVLAPIASFAPSDVAVAREWFDDELIAHARRALDAGHPATALWMLKHYYQEVSIIRAMRDVYAALDRPLHVAQADLWLHEHGDG